MKPASLLLVVVALVALGSCRKPSTDQAAASQAQAGHCSDLASHWAQAADAANGDATLTVISIGYSPSKQSCVVYYKSENPPVATYVVEDLTTHAPYSNQDCSRAQSNCDTAQAKSKAIFDELTKAPVNAKK